MYWPSFYRRGSAWSEMADLMNEMNRRAFGGNGNSSGLVPQLNAWTTEDRALVTAELPGIDPDNIEINVHDGKLTISGELPSREREEGETYHRRERFSGRFRRELSLPFRVDNDDVSAEYRNGVLAISLPRAEADKPRRIKVQAG